MNDIYRILQRFDNVSEGLSPEQEKVKQLPALFKPKNTSPQLSGPYPGKNATQGYLVGEGDIDPNRHPQTRDYQEGGNENAMTRAVTGRIMNRHPEWIVKYGVEALMQAIDDVTEDAGDFEEIGSSDISAYVQYVKDTLDDRMGSREEMDDRKPFAEGSANMSIGQQMARDGITYSPEKEKELIDLMGKYMQKAGMSPKSIRYYLSYDEDFVSDQLEHLPRAGVAENTDSINEGVTSEDVLDRVKKSFADYLETVKDEVKKDSDIKDKKKGDDDIKAKDKQDRDLVKKDDVKEDPTEEDPVVQMPTHPVEDPTYAECATVKTITLEDGRACEIYGNEQQGFGIRHGGRNLKSRFRNLDQAQLALEMYMARCKTQPSDADYIEEKK